MWQGFGRISALLRHEVTVVIIQGQLFPAAAMDSVLPFQLFLSAITHLAHRNPWHTAIWLLLVLTEFFIAVG